MSCDSIAKLIPLYSYGELLPEEEDRVEAHMFECAACAREIERQRAIAGALDARALDAPPELLRECRTDLMAAIAGGAPREAAAHKSPWTLFWEAVGFTLQGAVRFRQPVGATALVAVGFFAARLAGVWTPLALGTGVGATQASLGGDSVFSTVRSVQPDNAGRVQIVLDETRRKVVSGARDDQNIQRMLLAGAHGDNAAVRVEAVDLLKDRCSASTEVRDALLNALSNDGNPGVRLKALEGLKPLAADPSVRKTLAQVLLSDDNPAVRMQAVDLLVTHRDDSVVGVLQHLVQREDNGYVRLKCEKALKEMNASVGTF